MRRLSLSLFASLLLAATRLLNAADASPVEAFGTVPQIDHVSMSPDGNLLAWHDQRDGQSKVVLFDLNARNYKRVMPLKPQLTPRALSWADNHTLLATLSWVDSFDQSKTENFSEVYRTQAFDVESGQAQTLLKEETEKKNTWVKAAFVMRPNVLVRRPTKPNTVIMSLYHFRDEAPGAWGSEAFEVDTRTGKGTRLDSISFHVRNWFVDHNGKLLARVDTDQYSKDLHLLVKDGDRWRRVSELRGDPVHLSRDEKSIVARTVDEKGHHALAAFPLDGSKPTTLIDDASLDVEAVVGDPAGGWPVGVVLSGPEEPYRSFDPEAERLFKAAASSFPGKEISVLGRSDDSRRAVVEVGNASTPPSFYVLDFEKHTAESIGDAYPALAGQALAPVQILSYKARDGADVPAYLTLPANASGGRLPLVVMPHDGPHERDSYAFDWFAQFLAARGYAVLQPQFRGSEGFGDAWQRAGLRQWGKLMQDDLTDGVKAMVDKGVADARRICIAGIGYGGYAALAGAAFTPDTYRCAASINGISDLPGMLNYASREFFDPTHFRDWVASIGAATEPQVLERSPRSGVQWIRIPILLMHASNDIEIPFSQSLTMSRYMEKYGKPATPVIAIPDADHGLTRSAGRQKMLAEVAKFLDANLQPSRPAVDDADKR
jgi:dienelactone hydrolase